MGRWLNNRAEKPLRNHILPRWRRFCYPCEKANSLP